MGNESTLLCSEIFDFNTLSDLLVCWNSSCLIHLFTYLFYFLLYPCLLPKPNPFSFVPFPFSGLFIEQVFHCIVNLIELGVVFTQALFYLF